MAPSGSKTVKDFQVKIIQEYTSYLASFMLLLTMYDDLKPDLSTWLPVIQERLPEYPNGTVQYVHISKTKDTEDERS